MKIGSIDEDGRKTYVPYGRDERSDTPDGRIGSDGKVIERDDRSRNDLRPGDLYEHPRV